MPNWKIEIIYDEYCWECEQEGITPKSMADWWEEQI